ncbi:MAG: DEAD/DEAH box helicase [Pseudomonadota bacterium]
MSFALLGLAPTLLRAVEKKGYVQATPVQAAVIPSILEGRDVLATAQTGSGKTAAFCLPLLQRLAPAVQRTKGRRPTLALILVPTRELAAQVGQVLRELGESLDLPPKVAVVFGGVSINPQMMGLRGGADVLVATPGRLLDLVGHNAVALASVECLVVDEADRLVDLGFDDELSRLLALLPEKRQSLFFSATFPPKVQRLAEKLLREPQIIAVPAEVAAGADVVQRAIEVDMPRRTALLKHLVAQEKWPRVLVFVATKHAAETVADKLRKGGLPAEPFHGELSQGKRTQVLDDFKAERVRIVVATDVAARGLDIALLPVVVNFDLPRSPVDYQHRIGRTARAGAAGLSVTFLTPQAQAHFKLIEKRQGGQLVREQVAGFEPTESVVPDGNTSNDPLGVGGIKGKRPSRKDKLRAAAELEKTKAG